MHALMSWQPDYMTKVQLPVPTHAELQDVLILGTGAFALEAMEAAHRSEARNITLVGRTRDRLPLPGGTADSSGSVCVFSGSLSLHVWLEKKAGMTVCPLRQAHTKQATPCMCLLAYGRAL